MAGPSPQCTPRLPRAKANGADETRLSRRDQDDERLLDAMRRNTEATIGELAKAVGKSRSSIVTALHRLRDAGLAESAEGRWKLTEEPPPREPPAKWTALLERRRATHPRPPVEARISPSRIDGRLPPANSEKRPFWTPLRASAPSGSAGGVASFAPKRSGGSST